MLPDNTDFDPAFAVSFDQIQQLALQILNYKYRKLLQLKLQITDQIHQNQSGSIYNLFRSVQDYKQQLGLIKSRNLSELATSETKLVLYKQQVFGLKLEQLNLQVIKKEPPTDNLNRSLQDFAAALPDYLQLQQLQLNLQEINNKLKLLAEQLLILDKKIKQTQIAQNIC